MLGRSTVVKNLCSLHRYIQFAIAAFPRTYIYNSRHNPKPAVKEPGAEETNQSLTKNFFFITVSLQINNADPYLPTCCHRQRMRQL